MSSTKVTHMLCVMNITLCVENGLLTTVHWTILFTVCFVLIHATFHVDIDPPTPVAEPSTVPLKKD